MYIQVEIMFIGFNTTVEASLFSATENMNESYGPNHRC